MSRLSEKNYYQILNVKTSASQAEIQKAYHLMKKTFCHGSLAVYSLMNSSEIDLFQQKIEEAFKTLSNERTRVYYDLNLLPDSPPELREIEPPKENLEALSFRNDLSMDPELHRFLANIEEACTGKLLRKYREWLGTPLEEIAFETRIKPEYLYRIEEDMYSGLPHEVYLRSYLQQYAKCLGINAKEVSEGFLKKFRYWKNYSSRV